METLGSVAREGRDRLYPSLTNPNWLVLRRRREIFRKWLAAPKLDSHDLGARKLNGRKLDVLDLGGRIQPYRPLLEDRVRRYVAIDLRWTPLVNIVARGEQIPLAGGQFDLVICTQTLEFIPEPAVVIAEIHRVLKPGGCLLLSAPSVYPCESDSDRWRFLPGSLRQLVAVFGESEIIPEGGSIVGFFRTVNICLNTFVRYPVLRSIFRWTICPLLNLSGELLTRVAGSANDQFAANYSVWARK
ncbi:MAG TPA: class I SAM-dependent methyltransferase [Candidatus Sulfotelmatobacter sp.]|jgi:SAM-dependent methyltransferase